MRGTLDETLGKVGGREMEKTLEIVYQPQARFKVQAVTRCSSSIPGTYRKWVWLPCKWLKRFHITEVYPQLLLQYCMAQWILYSIYIVSFPDQFSCLLWFQSSVMFGMKTMFSFLTWNTKLSYMYSANNIACVVAGHTEAVIAVRFSPDGR